MSGHRIPYDLFSQQNKAIKDPGSAGTIRVDRDLAHVALVSAGAEARTLAVPTQANLRMLIYAKTLVGNVTLTITSGGDEAGDTSFVFTATGQYLNLVSVEEGSTVRWRVVSSDGVTGGTAALGTVTAAGSLKSTSASGGIGYATGAGSAVTQATSKSTGVTVNAVCGAVTTHNAALAAAAEVSFTVTNSSVAATDVVVCSIKSGATAGAYVAQVDAIAAGSFQVSISNQSAGSLGEAVVINFVVIKAVAA